MLKGKTAIVTGGSRGIGAAIAEKFASMGANIAVIYAGNQEAAEAVCCPQKLVVMVEVVMPTVELTLAA